MFKAYFTSLLSLCSQRFLVIAAFMLMNMLTASISIASDVDPTRPFGGSNASTHNKLAPEKGFVLSSIIHGDGIHTAVINGKIYKMFDYIGEYRITAINSHNVILRSKSKRLKINIFKSKGFKSHVLKDNVVENTVANSW
ncbi:hypothetical protein [Colwellia ponticola]|nr:hypothetical protein [Colwellia ponticola]